MKKKVFLTGATRATGDNTFWASSLAALSASTSSPSSSEHQKTLHIRQFEDMENLSVGFGDVTGYSSVLASVTGADVVPHTGAVVSPFADPELTRAVNVGGARNIVRAIRSPPEPDAVRLLTIGTVAQSADRNPPHHWGRVGDPLRVSHYDEYGQGKVIAERGLIDAGLRNIISLWQEFP